MTAPSSPISSVAESVRGWSPAPVTTTGSTTSWAVGAFSALLDTTCPAGFGDDLPPLWHWFGFLEHPRRDELGDDGHPAHGPFMPPLPDRRRMIAGGRLEIVSPLRVDEQLERRSSLVGCTAKSGRSGDMLLVTVRHEFARHNTVVVTEEQDIVYRSQPPGQQRGMSFEQSEGESSTPSREAVEITPDEATLFRFSALTYNTHRIHYDHPYVVDVEGYPGLVVHGPLLALLLLEIPRRHRTSQPVRHFAYRLNRPVFAGQRVVADVSDTPTAAGLALAAGVPGAPPSITATVDF
jgi:3-methylfumaryl-CoA hydratase